MINDVNFSEEIEKIAEIFFRNITCDVELLEIKFEFYSERRDYGVDSYVNCAGEIDSPEFEVEEILEFYNIFSAIRKKCIEKWYIAELKFYPDKTWDIEFVYGEIPEV